MMSTDVSDGKCPTYAFFVHQDAIPVDLLKTNNNYTFSFYDAWSLFYQYLNLQINPCDKWHNYKFYVYEEGRYHTSRFIKNK